MGSTKCSIFLIDHPVVKQKLEGRDFPPPIGPWFCFSGRIILALPVVWNSGALFPSISQVLWNVHIGMRGKFMPVGFGEYCWHHPVNYFIMDLWKSRFMEPYLGTFTALSCASGQDSPRHFSGNSLSLFLFYSKAKYFFKCSFRPTWAIKKSNWVLLEGQKTRRPHQWRIFSWCSEVLLLFTLGLFCMLTFGSLPTPFVFHFVINPWMKIGWE